MSIRPQPPRQGGQDDAGRGGCVGEPPVENYEGRVWEFDAKMQKPRLQCAVLPFYAWVPSRTIRCEGNGSGTRDLIRSAGRLRSPPRHPFYRDIVTAWLSRA